jgi:hypothetical protein
MASRRRSAIKIRRNRSLSQVRMRRRLWPAAVPLPMHSTSGAWKEIEFPATLALLLGADLRGAPKRLLEGSLKLRPACDLATDVADQATEPGPKQAQLPPMALELLGVSIASSHHRRPLGDAQIGLSQLKAVRIRPVKAALPNEACC